MEFKALRHLFGWVIKESYIEDTPLANIQVARPRSKLIQPSTEQQIQALLKVCSLDFERLVFLASRNRAIILSLYDTGVRAAELCGMKLTETDEEKGWIKITGKRQKERVVRLGKNAQKALWRYLMVRPQNGRQELWLTEEGHPLHTRGLGFADRC